LKDSCKNNTIPNDEFETRRALAVQKLGASTTDMIITEPGPSMRYFTNVQWGLSERVFLFVVLKNGTNFFIW
jgi:hypothetical protein